MEVPQCIAVVENICHYVIPLTEKGWDDISREMSLGFNDVTGLGMCQYELQNYCTHVIIWRWLNTLEFESALILEDNVQVVGDLSLLFDQLSEQKQEWDLYFPFDGGHKLAYCNDETCGDLWGSQAYFLNQNALAALQKRNTIDSRLDSALLSLSTQGIKVTYGPTENLAFRENLRMIVSRREHLTKFASKLTVWSGTERQQAINVLDCLISIARGEGIELTLFFGTLLGHIRHAGIIAWDDDIDVVVDEDQIEKLTQLISKTGILEWSTFYHRNGEMKYYKFWSADGKTIPGFNHKFPFVDVWTYRKCPQKIIFFPQLSEFDVAIFFPLQVAKFEGLDVLIPSHPLACLDICYSDWRRYAVIYPWSHRVERRIFPSLKVLIETDLNGAFVRYI